MFDLMTEFITEDELDVMSYETMPNLHRYIDKCVENDYDPVFEEELILAYIDKFYEHKYGETGDLGNSVNFVLTKQVVRLKGYKSLRQWVASDECELKYDSDIYYIKLISSDSNNPKALPYIAKELQVSEVLLKKQALKESVTNYITDLVYKSRNMNLL